MDQRRKTQQRDGAYNSKRKERYKRRLHAKKQKELRQRSSAKR